MRFVIAALCLFVFLSKMGIGQLAPSKPIFEAAEVHVSPAGTTESGAFLPAGRLEFRGSTLLRLISLAYSVPADRVAGGPPWIDTDRFDVIAKAPAAASQATLRIMLQNLLAERFELSVQQQEKPTAVYALVLGKRGPGKESGGGDSECKITTEENLRVYTCRNVSMSSLAERLLLAAPAYFNRPVVDRTGLKGSYDFSIRWLPRGQLPAGAEGHSLSAYASIEKQLDIKVEEQTVPMPVFAIEKVNREPADNPPGISEKLGPPPTEFEVATIRPSRPDATSNATVNNGRIDAQGLSLKEIISFAYNIEEDWVKGGEKWLETDRYDLVAKSVPTASADTIRVMVQSLIAERFQLKVHRESQPVSVYVLSAPAKHKLKEADPDSRSGCKLSVADGGRSFACQNTTMAQFVEKLRPAAAAYLEDRVVDATGLTGAYDFTLTWMPRNLLNGAPAAAPEPGAVTPPADRPGGLTVFEAVDRHLGLKLARQKHPMPVIVIDTINRKPAAN